ncbi:MAG: hypothetical protein NTNFB02_32780 [Nitrospira sp.]
MAVLTDPPNGGIHHHMSYMGSNPNHFAWSNTNPVVNGTHWRLKIGSAPFGYNLYPGNPNGNPVPFGQLYDDFAKPNVNLSNRKIYATVEWQDNAGNWNSGGVYSTITCMQ